MITRRDAIARITMPIKALAQRFAFLILLGAAGGILMVGKADPRIFERTRIAVVDASAPILDAVSRPVATVASIVEEANHLIHLREENATLRQENARLLQWRSAAQVLSSENKQLRDLLRFVPDDPATYITSRVIADSGGAGRQRGGLGVRRSYDILKDNVLISTNSDRHDSAPWGLMGGLEPDRTTFTIFRDNQAIRVPGASNIECRKGDRFTIEICGGGGYGEPKDRDHDAVRDDLRCGRITEQAAVEVYGLQPQAAAH